MFGNPGYTQKVNIFQNIDNEMELPILYVRVLISLKSDGNGYFRPNFAITVKNNDLIFNPSYVKDAMWSSRILPPQGLEESTKVLHFLNCTEIE